jgi:hypothetical protein
MICNEISYIYDFFSRASLRKPKTSLRKLNWN